jgi:hypothetical protein
MKVVVRSSSLLFFLAGILLGLPVHRRSRRVGNGNSAAAGTAVELTALSNSPIPAILNPLETSANSSR